MKHKTKESLNLSALLWFGDYYLDNNYFKCTCSDLEEVEWLKRNEALEGNVVNKSFCCCGNNIIEAIAVWLSWFAYSFDAPQPDTNNRLINWWYSFMGGTHALWMRSTCLAMNFSSDVYHSASEAHSVDFAIGATNVSALDFQLPWKESLHFLKKLEDISSFCRSSDVPVLPRISKSLLVYLIIWIQ